MTTAHLINAAVDVHADDPEFGYRLIADELIHVMGFHVGENRVQRLCALQGISSSILRRRGSGKKAGPAVHDDHVNRDFTADVINVKWLVDITEHRTMEGKIYLCAIKDCASNRIVGYAIDSRMTSELAVTALRMAIILRGRPAGTIVHSDRGGQFRSKRFSMMLRNNGLVGSMGRSRRQVTRPPWSRSSPCSRRTSSTARRGSRARNSASAIVTWIERTYHRRRRQRGLGRLTPIEFGTIYNHTALAA